MAEETIKEAVAAPEPAPEPTPTPAPEPEPQAEPAAASAPQAEPAAASAPQAEPAAASAPQAENAFLEKNRTMTLRARKGSNMAILPGGVRRPAAPYMHARYTMGADAEMLAQIAGCLTQDWQRDHQNWHYQWPIRQNNQTAAFIRAGWYVPVPFDALETSNPMAAVSDIVTPGGRYVVWKSHILVAVPPDKHQALVTQYEDFAVARTVNNAEETADKLDQMFSSGGFKSEVRPFTDRRWNTTGE